MGELVEWAHRTPVPRFRSFLVLPEIPIFSGITRDSDLFWYYLRFRSFLVLPEIPIFSGIT